MGCKVMQNAAFQPEILPKGPEKHEKAPAFLQVLWS